MTTTQKPEIGQDVEANGIRTNYLAGGTASDTWCWSTGPAPASPPYANWRLVIPALGARTSR